MPTPRSVDNIKSKLLQPALTSHFEVQIPIPENIKENVLKKVDIVLNSVEQDRLNLMCCEVSLPGSSLATLEINNDYTGVTERHAHRRIYDDRIDLTFYVNADSYLPIIVFESWIKYIAGESVAVDNENRGVGTRSKNYFYRVRYPDSYIADQGLKVIKFERDYNNSLQYEFIRAYPISITSIPISYESSNLLKCTVSMTYIRYVVSQLANEDDSPNLSPITPTQQAYFNSLNPTFNDSTFTVGGVPEFAANASGNSVYTSESFGPQSTLAQIYQNI